jgi:uncharacterized SAM-binding protein YcdF (DUF218 family)
MHLNSDFTHAVTLPFRQKKVPKTRLWFLPVLVLLTVAWGYKSWQVNNLEPEAIFVLGGHEIRERAAAKLAAQHPHLPVWVSAGSPEGYVRRIFKKAGIEEKRLHLNYQAQDTVTNFTTLVSHLQSQGIQSVYLVTSESHITRAYLVGELIFGSRGIALKPTPIASPEASEPAYKSARDIIRALLWLGTGRTGARL